MKKVTVLITLLIALVSVSTAQTAKVEDKLSAKYSSSEIKAMSAEELSFENHILENGYFIFDIDADKSQNSPINGTRKIDNLSNVNIYNLNITIKEEQYQYFKILGTNKAIAIKPLTLIKSEYLKK